MHTWVYIMQRNRTIHNKKYSWLDLTPHVAMGCYPVIMKTKMGGTNSKIEM